MSLSYSSESVIGGPFDQGVTTQIELRKTVIQETSKREPRHINYLASNTGWVRVISSVDTLEEGSFTSETAKNFILTGGTFNSSGGFNPNQDTSSYKKSATYGFIPTAGITSMQISSQGTFGTLRAASFNFTVHSPEDFSILEQLYLRPGFSILLEWGHSVHLSNAENGKVVETSNLFPIDKFLKKTSDIEIEKTIARLKGEISDANGNSYNYDAMFGIIKNFSWNYNGESYECQVDVVSKGEVVESVKTGMSPLVKIKEDKDVNDTKYTPYGSELEAYLTLIANSNEDRIGIDGTDTVLFQIKNQNFTLTDRIEKKYQDLDINRKFQVLVGAKSLASSTASGKEKYITLRTLLILVNEINMMYNGDTPFTPFNVGEQGIKHPFLTFPEHIGLNLGICILPKTENTLIKNISASADQTEDILEIYVSVSFLLNIIREKIKNNDSDTTVVDFINKDVLGSIQSNLGDINYFDLQEDVKLGVTYMHVVDRKVIPSKNDIKTKLDLVGLKSEVYNLNIVSKLTNNLTSMIAISAQDNYSPSSAQDLYNIQKWNTGLRDRHLTNLKIGKSTETTPEVDPDKIKTEQLREKLTEYITRVNNAVAYGPAQILPDPTGLEALHRQLMGEYVRQYTNKGTLNRGKTNPPGLIPFELSFTIKGIAGIKVGQAFTINDFFLPKRYKGHVAFIVVGVDHSIADSRWTTTIRSQMIYI